VKLEGDRKVRIVEVGPRDGLQNEKTILATPVKLEFIRNLIGAGCVEIEATSFVSRTWTPQLADADELWKLLPEPGIYSALVPNEKGLERALNVGVKRIALFTAASESFVMRNINRTIQQSLDEFAKVVSMFRDAGGKFVRGYVSTVIECPFAGKISPLEVSVVSQLLLDLGADEICLGETVGVAVPDEIRKLTEVVLKVVPVQKLTYHFHDTRGTAIANVAAALEFGIRSFDSSAAGLGGCPYAPGAGGNVATEDLVYFLERSGYDTGIDLAKLAKASLPILTALNLPVASKAQRAILAENQTC